MDYAFFNCPITAVYEVPAESRETPDGIYSAVSDEALYGMICKVLAIGGTETADDLPEGWAEIVTFYGHHGFVKSENLLLAGESKMRGWLAKRYVQLGRTTDVMAAPSRCAVRLMTLERGSRMERMPERRPGEEDNGSPVRQDGWARVCLEDRTPAYVRSVALEPQRYSLGAVFYWQEGLPFNEALAKARGLAPEQMQKNTLDTWFAGSEDMFRQAVCDAARQYLGVQYRMGGSTGCGIDGAGLAFMAYLQNGVLIYRGPEMPDGWPVHPVALDAIKPGDLLFFGEHTAIYLGEKRYIHATDAPVSGGVVVNSLDEKDARYREDLADQLTVAGSIF